MEEKQKEVLIQICKILKENKITDLEWNRYKFFIDMQYKDDKEKIIFNRDKDNLKQQLDNMCFYSIGSTD